jgi:hypothetical protein
MKRSLAAAQITFTLAVLAFVPGNFAKLALLLIGWILTFRQLTRKEWMAVIAINIIFVLNDIGAIKNGFFLFNEPDALGLPVWEFFMWGFYLLHLARLFPPKQIPVVDVKVIVLAVVFSVLFAVVPDRSLLLALTVLVLTITLGLYRCREDFIYCAYMMLIGIAFEFVGIYFRLWSYPERNYWTALLQFEVMWGASGVFFRRLLIGWLYSENLVQAGEKK